MATTLSDCEIGMRGNRCLGAFLKVVVGRQSQRTLLLRALFRGGFLSNHARYQRSAFLVLASYCHTKTLAPNRLARLGITAFSRRQFLTFFHPFISVLRDSWLQITFEVAIRLVLDAVLAFEP